MKRIISLLAALAALSCLLVGCGSGSSDDSSSKKSKKSAVTTTKSSSSVRNSSGDEEDEEDDTDEDEDEDEDEDDGYDDEDQEYMDVLEETFDAINDEDFETAIRNIFPEVILDVVEDSGEVDIAEMGESITQMFAASETKKRKVLPITLGKVSGKAADDDELGKFNKSMVSVFSDDELEIYEDDIPEITDAYFLKVKYELASGEECENEMVAYYLDGEGWKVDMGFFEYIAKSKRTSANAAASSLQKSAESALTDLDAKGYKLDGKYIISSDESLNYKVPDDFPLDEMKKEMTNYFSNLKKYDYFIVVDRYSAVYVVCKAMSGSNDAVGTYPSDQTYDGSESSAGYDYDELYDICKDALK